jgi:hypothetical protein
MDKEVILKRLKRHIEKKLENPNYDLKDKLLDDDFLRSALKMTTD